MSNPRSVVSSQLRESGVFGGQHRTPTGGALIRFVRELLVLASLLVGLAGRAKAQLWVAVPSAPDWLFVQQESVETAASGDIISAVFRINIPGMSAEKHPYAYWTSKASVQCKSRLWSHTVVLRRTDDTVVDADYPQDLNWIPSVPGTLSGMVVKFLCRFRGYELP